jgi:hypothetical protein
MGTQGKKNTPITARVNAGLFNQKKGITEPLLGVGPAGVYGNNQTKDIPSPSKMRGYAKRSPLKQKADEGDIKVITPGQDTTKKVTVPGTPGTANYDAAVAAEGTKQVDPKKITPEMTAKANKKRADAKAADVAAAKPIEKEVVVKGKPRERPVQTRDSEDTQTARERSNTVRGGKRMNRKEKNAAIKEAKAQARIDNPDDRKARRKAVKSAKNEAKLTQAKKDRKLAAASGAGAQRQAEQNRSISARKTGTLKSNERNLRESDMSESTKNTLVDKDLGVDTTTQAITNPTDVSGVTQEEIKGQQKNVSGAFKGKSPMKKRGFGMKKPLYK